MWRRNDLGFPPKFVYKIQNDQVHFPPSVVSRQCDQEAHISDQWAHTASQKICSGCVQSRYFFAEWLLPGASSTCCCYKREKKHVTITLWGQSNQEKRFTMHVADGNNHIFTVKGASHFVCKHKSFLASMLYQNIGPSGVHIFHIYQSIFFI
jgi:hypothetical protein